ncbi:MAG TPA: PEGA domain-containing protein [Polyangia bacterium]|nr:PEGA domain-containing protein [Polyangia bacterium]
MPTRFLVTLAIVLAAPSPARADDDAEASARYEAGQKFYGQGAFEDAIAAYEAAYKLKPHPNALYSIAQAYERLLDYGKSVEYFERYLKEAPPDAADRVIVINRLRALRNLPARVSVTTIPEHVHAAIEGGGQRLEAETPAMFKVPAGDYQIALDQPGWEEERHDVHADLGQPYFYQYRLKRSTSMVSIFTRPRGARVFVDDKLMGETPFADAIEVGKHRLLLEHPDYPWHREELDVQPGLPVKREIKLSKPVRSGRTELVIASMVYGGAAGPLLVATFSSSSFVASGVGLTITLLSAAAGVGAGFIASFLPTKDGIKVGHSSLIIGGGAWGTSLGTGLALGLDLSDQYIFGLALLGGGIGITTAVLVSHWNDVMPGTAAIMNSGGFWGTGAGALMAQAIFLSPSKSQFGWFVVGGTSLGVLAGSLVAWKIDISRGHVFLVDIGGLAGTGLAFALGFAYGYTHPPMGVSAQGNGVQAGCQWALGGMVVGLLTAAVLARNYRGDLPPVEALLMREHGRWALGIPNFRIEQALTPEGSAPRFALDLAKGRW